MWILSNRGFWSVVEDRNDPNNLLVRARTQRDILTFQDLLEDKGELVGTHWTPLAGYAWRLTAKRENVVAVVSLLVADIDYDNFKDSVADRQGIERSMLYHEIWFILRRMQHVRLTGRGE